MLTPGSRLTASAMSRTGRSWSSLPVTMDMEAGASRNSWAKPVADTTCFASSRFSRSESLVLFALVFWPLVLSAGVVSAMVLGVSVFALVSLALALVALLALVVLLALWLALDSAESVEFILRVLELEELLEAPL